MDSTSIRLKDYKIVRLELSGDYKESDLYFAENNDPIK